MSHTKPCLSCFTPVMDIDDGVRILEDYHVIIDSGTHIIICDNCFRNFKHITKVDYTK